MNGRSPRESRIRNLAPGPDNPASRATGVGAARALPLLAFLCAAACANPETERLKETTKPTYDRATGRLTELTYDANGNGRVDTWTEMEGTRPVRARMDRDEDGTLDRWEYYDERGQLVKVGFSRASAGTPDAWAYPAADGTTVRVEVSSSGDERRITRWERYEASKGDAHAPGAALGAEEDTNGDGRVDRWETYEAGVLKTAAFDEDHDGRPDRKFTYAAGVLVLIEEDPDASGVYRKRVPVK